MDKRLIITVGIVIAFLIFSYPILAAATAPPVVIEKDGQGRPTVIVEQGKGKDTGLIKVTQIHYARSSGKVKPLPTETCYKLSGWKWTSPVLYTINTADYTIFSSAIELASSTWDEKTSRELFSPPTSGLASWSERTDGKNSILFGNYPDAGVIAVTRTWYTRGTKIAVESDILFDNVDFDWGDGDPAKMDIQNIATHEIGHTLGLSDTYTTLCTAVTMYGYSTEGETDKRTLEQPDINGLVKIYGL